MLKKIRYLGDSILRKECRPVEKIDSAILRIAEELSETVKAHDGLGLAAPQIGYDLAMFAVWVSDQVDNKGEPLFFEPKIFINPKITRFSEDKIVLGEGCLSIPGFYQDIERPKEIDVEALGVDGNLFKEIKVRGWRARCIQHEYDHLHGVLFVDRLPSKEKQRVHNELVALEMRLKCRALGKEGF